MKKLNDVIDFYVGLPYNSMAFAFGWIGMLKYYFNLEENERT